MEFLDKVKDTVREVDSKISDKLDFSSLDIEIMKEKKLLDQYASEIGKKVIDTFDTEEGFDIHSIRELLEKVRISKANIRALTEKKESSE
ncbi:MAG: hypothetical protein J5494_08925 [Candidatus Methanomethylophilaceae archaeon]|nr:hypothetical protein [Candidatus Methanomethylophilaceae archaeon]